jgi:hypothetical protein
VHGSTDQHKSSKIEATTAKAEALSKGLHVFLLTSTYVAVSPNLYLNFTFILCIDYADY